MKIEEHSPWQFGFADYAGGLPVRVVSQRSPFRDDTFETVCALLSYARLQKQGKELKVVYFIGRLSADIYSEHDSIFLYICPSSAKLEAVAGSVTPPRSDLAPCPTLGLFIKQKSGMPAHIFYSVQRNFTLITLAGNGDTTSLHLAAALFPQLAPWIFKDSPCTPQELAILKALTLGDKAPLRAQWQQMISADSFCQNRLAGLLAGFTGENIQERLNSLEKEYQDKLTQLNVTLLKAAALQKSAEDLADRQMQLQQRLLSGQDKDDELLHFLQASPQVRAIRRESTGGLRLCIHTHIDTVDEDLYDNYIRKSHLSIYLTPAGESPYTESAMKSFYKALWEEHRFKLRTWAEFVLFPDGSLVFREDSASRARESSRMPHPHLVRYHCLGTYEMQLNEAARQHDPVAAVNIVAGAARTLNLSDGFVGRAFLEELTHSPDCAFLEDEHGSLFTFPQVMELLQKEQEESTHES